MSCLGVLNNPIVHWSYSIGWLLDGEFMHIQVEDAIVKAMQFA
jgi:hypothetical protein